MGRLLVENVLECKYDYHRHVHGRTDSLEDKLSIFSYDDDTENGCHDSKTGGSDSSDPGERALYWESEDSLLQEILERYSLTGSKLREEIVRIVRQVRETNFCCCLKPSSGGCISCLRRRAVDLLCEKGFKATMCTSKWKHTNKFPGGKHEYIEVAGCSEGKEEQVQLVIELELREQFEIARACEEYRKLLKQLPELYVGKLEYLQAIVRLLCDAAERSMKERKIHMGPWRKRSFVQMKWLNSSSSRRDCFMFKAAEAVV